MAKKIVVSILNQLNKFRATDGSKNLIKKQKNRR